MSKTQRGYMTFVWACNAVAHAVAAHEFADIGYRRSALAYAVTSFASFATMIYHAVRYDAK